MSLQFSNTTTKNGIIQRLERRCAFNDGDISGNATRLAQFTGDVNVAIDKIFSIIFEVGGTWQFDDINHSLYPIITANIVAGQRDYAFTSDQNSNLILEIHKVFVADSNGLFTEMTPVDVPQGASSNFTDGLNVQGIPNSYDKLANGIFLDPIPSYNRTGGIKIYIAREGNYFLTTDTSKKPGFAGLFHEYLVLHPALQYSLIYAPTKVVGIKNEMLEIENAVREHYKSREKDVHKTVRPRNNNPH